MEPRNRKVAICTPAYGGMIHVQHAQSVVYAIRELTNKGFDVGWVHYGNVASTTRARNAMVSEAVKNGADDIVFIDGDVAFKPETLLRLLKHDVDLVGGAVRSNVYTNDPQSDEPQNPFPYVVEPLINEEGNAYFNVVDGVAEVASVPTAFMRIRAKPLVELMAKVPELQYWDERITGADHFLYALFDHRIYPHAMPEHKAAGRRSYQGEDYSFCRLWREHGGKVHADMTLPLRHIKLVNLDGSALVALEMLGKKGIMKQEGGKDE